MVKKDVEELYNALKEVKNASIKRKIAQAKSVYEIGRILKQARLNQ